MPWEHATDQTSVSKLVSFGLLQMVRLKTSVHPQLIIFIPTLLQGQESEKWKWKLLSRVRLFVTHGLYSPWNSPGPNTGVASDLIPRRTLHSAFLSKLKKWSPDHRMKGKQPEILWLLSVKRVLISRQKYRGSCTDRRRREDAHAPHPHCITEVLGGQQGGSCGAKADLRKGLLCAHVSSHFSRVQLFVTLWTVAHQAPLSIGFPSQEHWSVSPCPPPGESSQLRGQTHVSHFFCWKTWSLPLAPPGKPHCGLVAKSGRTLCNPTDCGLPGPSVHGISQARKLEWTAISSRGSSRPRDWTCVSCVSCIGRQVLYHWATREAHN